MEYGYESAKNGEVTKYFAFFRIFGEFCQKKTETWAPLTSEVYFDRIYMHYSH